MPRLRDNSNRANEMTMLQHLTTPAAVAAPTPPQSSRDYDQIRRAIDSITANVSEGFEQPTDRAFANFLFISKGSTAESRKRLAIALARRYITADQFKTADAAGTKWPGCSPGQSNTSANPNVAIEAGQPIATRRRFIRAAAPNFAARR